MITLPGPVEIDECHIGARVRGAQGRPPAPGSVVFGIKCRSTGRVLLFPIPDKTRQTLHPIIIGHIEQGADISLTNLVPMSVGMEHLNLSSMGIIITL